MATGFKVGATDIDAIFIWDATGAQSDDSTGYKLSSGLDVSKYMYNASTNSYVSGYKKAGTDLGSLYCTSGCNAVCTGGCTGTCTTTCGVNGCSNTCKVYNTCQTSCAINCSSGCSGID